MICRKTISLQLQEGMVPGIINTAERKDDIAMASRALTEEEKSSYGNQFQEFLIGYGDIVIAISQAVYNKELQTFRVNRLKISTWAR